MRGAALTIHLRRPFSDLPVSFVGMGTCLQHTLFGCSLNNQYLTPAGVYSVTSTCNFAFNALTWYTAQVASELECAVD